MKEKDNINFYKATWLFFFGCLFGYIFECLFYVLKYGNFVNKQGLILGPFKPIYGLGVLFISLIFSKVKKPHIWKIFLYGLLFGTVFEYSVSFLLEKIWNIYIWDYSNFRFNINGRIYLPYCIGWGLISLVWYYYLYPLFNKFYNYLKKKIKIFDIVTVLLFIFFIIDGILTFGIYFRIENSEKDNTVYKVLDNMFPKEVIDSRFSKVRRIKNK